MGLVARCRLTGNFVGLKDDKVQQNSLLGIGSGLDPIFILLGTLMNEVADYYNIWLYS